MPSKVRDIHASPAAHRKPVAPADLWDQLDRIRHEVSRAGAEPEGEGWFKPAQYAEAKGFAPIQAQRVLFQLYKAGRIERWQSPKREVFYRISDGRTGRSH